MTAALKIALLSDWFFPRWGGLEQHILDLAHQLQARGHEVHVLTSFPGPEEMDGIPVVRLPGLRFPYFGFVISPLPFRRLKQVLEGRRYDVVHIHTSYIAPFAWGSAYVCQKMGVPTLMTFHSMLLQFARVLKIADHLLHWSSWRVVFTAVSAVVGKELEPILRQPLPILPNGTDVAFWKALAPQARPPETLRLVSVMRFGPRKRGAGLVRIFARFLSRLPAGSRPAHLTIVGDGRLRWQIQLIIIRLGLGSKTTLTGFLPRTDLRQVFQNSDIFILPGRVESFGISALEARSAGLPVVVHAGAGAAAFIRQGREGLVAGTDEEMATCLLRLATDENLRLAIADHNRTTWPDFDWSRVVFLHEDLYRRTIEDHGHH